MLLLADEGAVDFFNENLDEHLLPSDDGMMKNAI